MYSLICDRRLLADSIALFKVSHAINILVSSAYKIISQFLFFLKRILGHLYIEEKAEGLKHCLMAHQI